jgi:hypothetical protein
MIGFFRKIRKQLADDNQFFKYSRYAIGEILLVVIGILIALQINNWNENSKTKALELKTLKELRADLAQTTNDIRGDSLNFENIIRSNEIILHHMKEKLAFHDSLNQYFSGMDFFQTFSINHNTFDNIRQNGSSLITNDSIRIAISNFYTRPIYLYKELEMRVLNEHYENYYKPMIMQAFEIEDNKPSLPKNYIAFMGNSDYQQVLKYTVRICNGILNLQGYLLKTIEGIIGEIDREIQSF